MGSMLSLLQELERQEGGSVFPAFGLMEIGTCEQIVPMKGDRYQVIQDREEEPNTHFGKVASFPLYPE